MAELESDNIKHPDLLELELLRTNEAAEGVTEHVAQCSECREVLAQLDAVGGELEFGQVPCAPTEKTEKEVLEFIGERAASISTARRRRIFWLRVGWAAAAVALLCLGLVWYQASIEEPDVPKPMPPAIALREDINRDGQVDIVDAMLLARKLDVDEAIAPDFDFNEDGQVDTGDVETLAQQVVALGEGN